MSRLLPELLKYKLSLMGIAIILVVCCHSTIIGWHPLVLLSPGLIGCDIFMILSGSSLAFSYQSRPLPEFYKRRVARIVPMLLVFALSRCLLDKLSGQDITWTDYIYTSMLFSYFGWGGVEFDWYLTTSLIFYLFYPILYCQKKAY